MARMTKAEKAIQARADSLVGRALFGVQIPIMMIGKVNAVALRAVNLEDAEALKLVTTYVDSIRVK